VFCAVVPGAAFNATTTGAATQMGIFTGAYGAFSAEWSFPADTSLGSIVPELGDTTPSGVIVGTLSGTNYQMAVIVPEPSTFSLVAMACLVTAAARRRKRS
jgi:hypothetical protein